MRREIRLLKARQPEKKIQSIKALRWVTNMGLREAKDAVEALEFGPVERISGYTISIGDDADGDWAIRRSEFEAYFEWQLIRPPVQLKLWTVSVRSGSYLVLAETDIEARNALPANEESRSVTEIKGPFRSGQVLGKVG